MKLKQKSIFNIETYGAMNQWSDTWKETDRQQYTIINHFYDGPINTLRQFK